MMQLLTQTTPTEGQLYTKIYDSKNFDMTWIFSESKTTIRSNMVILCVSCRRTWDYRSLLSKLQRQLHFPRHSVQFYCELQCHVRCQDDVAMFDRLNWPILCQNCFTAYRVSMKRNIRRLLLIFQQRVRNFAWNFAQHNFVILGVYSNKTWW